MRLGTVILAAGASARMGRPKLLLPWGEKTILAHLIDQWRAVGAAQVGVVVEAGSAVEEEVARMEDGGWRMELIVNPQPEVGMFSSIQCAARWDGWAEELSHFAITLGDQPQVGVSTLKAIINFADGNAECICQPSRNGRPRHPVIMPKRFFLELAHASESDLKQFLNAREDRRKLIEVDDPGLDLDVDTPADYEKALSKRRASSGAPSS